MHTLHSHGPIIRFENYFGIFVNEFWDFFLAFAWRCVLFACSMAPTGVFLGFQSFLQSFKRFLGVFFAFHRFSLALNDFCFVLAVFGRVSRDLHTCDH